MGLNWHKGLEGASRGMETIMGVKEKEIDILYDEIVRENRQRFQTSEREAGQQFRSTEAATERDWRSAEGADERDWKGTENEADRQVRREANITAQNRIEEDRKYREGMLGIRDRETAVKEENAQGGADDEVTLETLQKLQTKRDEITGKLVPSDGDEQSLQEIDRAIDLTKKYGAYGAVAYDKIDTSMQGHPDTDRYAGLYATLDPKTRKAIDQAKGKYEGEGMPAGAAYMKAIDEHMTSSGGGEAKGSDTTLDKAASGAELESSVGDVASPETEMEVEDKVPAPKTPEFMAVKPDEGTEGSPNFTGPTAPKKQAREKPDMSIPAYEKTKPVREAGEKVQTAAKTKKAQRLERSLKSWVESGSLDEPAAKLIKRMHTKSEMKQILEGAGYSSNMVEQFMKYIYALNA